MQERKWLLGMLFLMLLIPAVSLADGQDTTCDPGAGMICNPLGDPDPSLEEYVMDALKGILWIGVPVLGFAFMYVGFLYVKAMGSPKEIEVAHGAAKTVVIGGAVFLGSVALAEIAVNTVTALG